MNTSSIDQTRTGSRRATKPRWLAREEPRQWIATLPGFAAIIWALTWSVDQDGERDWSVLFSEKSVQLIVLLGVMLLLNALLYFVLTAYAFRGAKGKDLAFIARASAPRTRAEAKRLKQNGLDEVYVAIGAGALSLATLVLLLTGPGVRDSPAATLGTLAAVIGAWLLIILGFAVRYLREWAVRGAISFPDNLDPPTLSDFGLVAVQMSTAYGFGHATMRASSVRRAALTHNVLGYVFNTVIIALVISVALPAVF
ncbi:DUF1345 domain-containing protein [Gulosibacter chungangensis]|uniref:DUF1345 domain-containing protein n=1 Tax=Gulosibacter chungangensis TaxID=979746 RepID=UPI00178804D5|nr:DUF1345 domain-containing protein [Gulosibacter chungangensis]